MPRRPTNEIIECPYFRWILYQRGGLYYADGRAKSLNAINLGRHSLSVTTRAEAGQVIIELDRKIAKRRGYQVQEEPNQLRRLTLVEGVTLFYASLNIPRVMGGVKAPTLKRYRSVFNKFLPFADRQGAKHWDCISEKLFSAYAVWLSENNMHASAYLELNTIKQIVNWLVSEGYLPQTARIMRKLRKPNRSERHCYSQAQVKAILAHCDSPNLQWLQWLVLGLVYFGLRIEELASLRWDHLDFTEGKEMLRLDDESQVASSPESKNNPSGAIVSKSTELNKETRSPDHE